MSKCHYLKLPNCEKVPIFSNNRCLPLEKPKFCDQFTKLWRLLFNVGLANGPTFSGIVDSFPIPENPSSKLVGVPFITDPSSTVRLFSFTNTNLLGPIVTDGYNLQTYNDSVFYEIKWNIRDNLEDFIIGFYRSDGFAEDTTNTFSLICGSRGASIFNRRSGKMVSPGISNLFVATNKDTIIDLEVTVIIPDKIVYPDLIEPYNKYMVVKDCCDNEFNMLVYTISFTDDTGANIIKQPSKYFIEATKVIQDFLIATGLSVTLMNSSEEKRISLACNNCVGTIGCGFRDIITREYYNPYFGHGNVSMNTNLVCNPQYWTVGVYQGIKLNTPDNKLPRITYEIFTFEEGVVDYEYTTTVVLQYKSGELWFTHDSVNNQGDPNGEAKTFRKWTSTGSTLLLNGSFLLGKTAEAFGITIYYGTSYFPPDAQQILTPLVKNTVFAIVSIVYEDKVIS